MRSIALSIILSTCCAPFLLAQSQFEMNQDAGRERKSADDKLNHVFKQIQQKYAKNPVFLKNLKSAQRIWLQFRDAQLAMKFPDRSPGYYGSVLPMCQANYLRDLTIARTKELEEWLKPNVEGDCCAGTLGEFELE